MHGQAAQFRVRCVQVGLPDGAREREKARGGHNKFVCIRLPWLRPIQLQLQLQIQLHLHLQLQLWLRPDLSIQSSSATAERQFQLEM